MCSSDLHAEFLGELFEKLKAGDQWPADMTIEIEKDFKLIFAEESKNIDKNVKVSTDEVEALDFAVKMENRGRAMYLELSEKASDPNEKNFYSILAKWEKGHADYCEDFYNYFQDNGMFTEE